MVYRNFDNSQWQNKIEALEARIRELEEENERLLRVKVQDIPNWEKVAVEHLRKAVAADPEFFMSTKEKEALKKAQQEERER